MYCRSWLRKKSVGHNKLQWALFWTELWNIFNNDILELKSIVKLTHWKNCQLNKDQIFIKENELNFKFSLKFGHFLQYSVLHMNISLEKKKKKSKFKGNFCKPFHTHYHNFGSLSSWLIMPKGSSQNTCFTDAFVSRLLLHDRMAKLDTQTVSSYVLKCLRGWTHASGQQEYQLTHPKQFKETLKNETILFVNYPINEPILGKMLLSQS